MEKTSFTELDSRHKQCHQGPVSHSSLLSTSPLGVAPHSASKWMHDAHAICLLFSRLQEDSPYVCPGAQERAYRIMWTLCLMDGP